MASSAVPSKTITLEDTRYYQGEPVLTYKISYPQFQTGSAPLVFTTINQYYEEKAFLLARYCNTVLYPQAVEQYKSSKKDGLPFFPYEVVRTYQIELLNDCYLSITSEVYIYTGGANGQTTLFSNVWDLSDGSFLLLKDFFPLRPNYQNEIMQVIISYIDRQNQSPDETAHSTYFGDAKQNVTESFNENNFYLTEDGLVIYFQPYDIAPHSSGIPRFLIPMDTSVCRYRSSPVSGAIDSGEMS